MCGFWILQSNHWASSLQIVVLMFGSEMCVEHVGVMGIYLYQRKIRLHIHLSYIVKFFSSYFVVGCTPSGVPVNCM